MKNLVILVVFIIYCRAINALRLRSDLLFGQTDADTLIQQQLHHNNGREICLSRGYRYEIGLTASDHDFMILFGVFAPVTGTKKKINVILVPEWRFPAFMQDNRVVDDIARVDKSGDLHKLLNEYSAYSLTCPSEIEFSGGSGIRDDQEQKYSLMLRLCTGNSFFDAPYQIFSSVIPFRVVLLRTVNNIERRNYFLPIMALSIDMCIDDRERLSAISNGHQQLKAYMHLFHLSGMYSFLGIQSRLAKIASVYIRDPNCPLYSTFSSRITDFPYNLKLSLGGNAAVQWLSQSIQREMNEIEMQLRSNTNRGFEERALAAMIFQASHITEVHLRRFRMMNVALRSAGFYKVLNSMIACEPPIHESERISCQSGGGLPVGVMDFDDTDAF